MVAGSLSVLGGCRPWGTAGARRVNRRPSRRPTQPGPTPPCPKPCPHPTGTPLAHSTPPHHPHLPYPTPPYQADKSTKSVLRARSVWQGQEQALESEVCCSGGVRCLNRLRAGRTGSTHLSAVSTSNSSTNGMNDKSCYRYVTWLCNCAAVQALVVARCWQLARKHTA